MSASEIVNKVWNCAHVLRDDGVGYGDYVEAAPGSVLVGLLTLHSFLLHVCHKY